MVKMFFGNSAGGLFPWSLFSQRDNGENGLGISKIGAVSAIFLFLLLQAGSWRLYEPSGNFLHILFGPENRRLSYHVPAIHDMAKKSVVLWTAGQVVGVIKQLPLIRKNGVAQ